VNRTAEQIKGEISALQRELNNIEVQDEAVKLLDVCPIDNAKHRWRMCEWERSISEWAVSMREGKFPVGSTIKAKLMCCCGARVTFSRDERL